MTVFSVPFFIGEPMSGFDVPEPFTTLDPGLPAGHPTERMAVLYDQLAGLLAGSPDPVVYAGDCLSIMGVTGGLQRRGIDPTVLFFDAHGDFHTWETTPSSFLGGMPLAMLTGRGEQTIVDGVGMTPVEDDRVWLIDGRDLDPGEDEAVATSGIHHVTVAEIATDPPPGDLYIHIDVDVVDPVDMPGVNYPAPDGPSADAVAQAVETLHRTGRVVALSLSSWNPALPGADVAAAATHQIAAPFL
ncbi:MAG: arginase family protein [Actinomycetota bacterium]|nr:arginase family protein [Actinomycetota bacterium]